MSSPELDALVIEHLVDLDRAAKRIDDIERKVFSAMNERAEQWAKRQGWKGEFELPESGGWTDWGIWLAPAAWDLTDDSSEGASSCRFEPHVGAGDTESAKPGEAWYYVTRLCGLEDGQTGFRFMRPDTVKKRQWQRIIDRFRDDIASTGFIVDSEPSFFLPFRVEPTTLAAALRDDDPGAALDPFTAALDTLLNARPAFDQIVQHLRAGSL